MASSMNQCHSRSAEAAAPGAGDCRPASVPVALALRAGKTVRSSVDCPIAACALLHDVEVVHCDRDYEAIAAVAPLRTHNVHQKRRPK